RDPGTATGRLSVSRQRADLPGLDRDALPIVHPPRRRSCATSPTSRLRTSGRAWRSPLNVSAACWGSRPREVPARSEPLTRSGSSPRRPLPWIDARSRRRLVAGHGRSVWAYAAQHGYVIVSKDAEFHQRSFLLGPPPKVVWIRRGEIARPRTSRRYFEHGTQTFWLSTRIPRARSSRSPERPEHDDLDRGVPSLEGLDDHADEAEYEEVGYHEAVTVPGEEDEERQNVDEEPGDRRDRPIRASRPRAAGSAGAAGARAPHGRGGRPPPRCSRG